MKVYTCENISSQTIKIFSSSILAENFKKEENERYDKMMIEQKILSDHNPGREPKIRELILAGKSKEIPELDAYMKECQEFNTKHVPFPEKIEYIEEYEVDCL